MSEPLIIKKQPDMWYLQSLLGLVEPVIKRPKKRHHTCVQSKHARRGTQSAKLLTFHLALDSSHLKSQFNLRDIDVALISCQYFSSPL